MITGDSDFHNEPTLQFRTKFRRAADRQYGIVLNRRPIRSPAFWPDFAKSWGWELINNQSDRLFDLHFTVFVFIETETNRIGDVAAIG